MNLIRVTAQASHKTFSITPINRLIKRYKKGQVLDLFPYPYQRDALQYIKSIPYESQDIVLYDPPYSQRQLREMYDKQGISYDMNSSYWTKINKEIFRVLKPGGICIKFGWNSSRISEFVDIVETMLVCHGGMHNDTIVTVQRKLNHTLDTKSKI